MRHHVAGHRVRYASIEVPRSSVVYQAALPGARLILQVPDLQINQYLVGLIGAKGGHRDGDRTGIDAKF